MEALKANKIIGNQNERAVFLFFQIPGNKGFWMFIFSMSSGIFHIEVRSIRFCLPVIVISLNVIGYRPILYFDF